MANKYTTLASIKDQFKEEKLSGWEGAKNSIIEEIAKTCKVWTATAKAVYLAVETHTMQKPNLVLNNPPEDMTEDDEEEEAEAFQEEMEDDEEEGFVPEPEPEQPQVRSRPDTRAPVRRAATKPAPRRTRG